MLIKNVTLTTGWSTTNIEHSIKHNLDTSASYDSWMMKSNHLWTVVKIDYIFKYWSTKVAK